MKMVYEVQKTARAKNRKRMIDAALQIWESYGEKAVTARAVAAKCQISGQRVCDVFKGMDNLRNAAAAEAVRSNRTGVVMQLQASGHPLAPRSESARLV